MEASAKTDPETEIEPDFMPDHETTPSKAARRAATQVLGLLAKIEASGEWPTTENIETLVAEDIERETGAGEAAELLAEVDYRWCKNLTLAPTITKIRNHLQRFNQD